MRWSLREVSLKETRRHFSRNLYSKVCRYIMKYESFCIHIRTLLADSQVFGDSNDAKYVHIKEITL